MKLLEVLRKRAAMGEIPSTDWMQQLPAYDPTRDAPGAPALPSNPGSTPTRPGIGSIPTWWRRPLSTPTPRRPRRPLPITTHEPPRYKNITDFLQNMLKQNTQFNPLEKIVDPYIQRL